jgi:thioredoxin-related protein
MLKSLTLLFSSLLFLTLSLNAQSIDLDKALQKADKEHKMLMVYLHRIGCSYCNSMDEFTLDDDKVIDFIEKHFIFRSVNITTDHEVTFEKKTTEGLEFAKETGYNFYPTVLFFDNKGELVYASVGYKDEFDFLVILQYVDKGLYKMMTLSEYKKAIGFKKNSDGEIIDTRKNAR